jgi:hypothetical protein
MLLETGHGLIIGHRQEDEGVTVMRRGASSLFGALAAGLILLATLAAGSAQPPARHGADASPAAFVAAGVRPVAGDPGTRDPCGTAAGCSACIGAHCTCAPGGFVMPGSADFAAPLASNPEPSAAARPASGLAKSPDERPPRRV